MTSRADKKYRTRRQIIAAALSQLSAEQSFSNLSLREVAREAGLAPTSFYRHFKDMDELGLTLVDEAGVTLRQLMRQARQRFRKNASVIEISVNTFMEFVEQSPNIFRLLLRERSGTSPAFRAAVNREIQHFIQELTDYFVQEQRIVPAVARLQAELMVTTVFNNGGEALDLDKKERRELAERTIEQLRIIALGAKAYKPRQQVSANGG